jgi:hypothetical protein
MKQTVFSINFVMDNAAFSDGMAILEVERILKKITTQHQNEDIGKPIVDINGNLIGQWEIKENETS